MVGDILQPTHLLFILVVALLVLGPKRLPEVGRTLGSGLRDFRAAINGESTHDDDRPNYVETGSNDSSTTDDADHVAFEHDEPADASPWDPSSTTGTATADHDDEAIADTEPDGELASATATTTVADDTSTAASALPEDEPAPERSAKASSAAFASALAASRQQTDGDAPVDHE
jgi:sec-independent protein translocase protein TatA